MLATRALLTIGVSLAAASLILGPPVAFLVALLKEFTKEGKKKKMFFENNIFVNETEKDLEKILKLFSESNNNFTNTKGSSLLKKLQKSYWVKKFCIKMIEYF